MDLGQHILALVTERGVAMTIVELVDAIPETDRAEVWLACAHLRQCGRLIRDGLGTSDDPYRFRVAGKNDGSPI